MEMGLRVVGSCVIECEICICVCVCVLVYRRRVLISFPVKIASMEATGVKDMQGSRFLPLGLGASRR